ncbi:pyruvate kinase isoform X2 [Drosophila teissieri]|uniref:pyruvate kinase isoform X1 n=1 Tax=Drosophila teissieri TaxID=7243 RepID=UPI001CBA26A8|nr:pyruvate kinase isoform X1 [Drosophila teissieri]XP_043655147.1 pyruvate kinase isoform X2 [Drosophila teissieri]
MRVVRMNFSHGSHEYHCQTIQAARKAIAMYVEQTGLPRTLAIALDTKGPEIRTGKLAGGDDRAEIELKAGDKVTLSTKKELADKSTKENIYVDYQRLPELVKPGNRIFVDDGLIALIVKEAKGDEVICHVENGGKLGSHKGINLPGIPVDLPSVTEKDKQDLIFGAEQKVDMIFASFIRDGNALKEIRQVLGPAAECIKIISKIENQQGLANIDEIIRESDGIMVARGDMGIEIPTEDVPLAQKSIVAKCNKVGKPVICATQMMESMTSKPRPTRAEASDVANAIFDGSDAVMLSGETAKGKYPVECVQCMARICAKVEAVLWYESLQNSLKREIRTSAADHISAVTTAIAEAATVGQARAIVVASPCSMVAQMVSHMRPPCPIVMLTGSHSEAAQSLLFRGVYPLLVEEMVIGSLNFRRIMQSGLKLMGKMDILEPGQKGSVVVVNAMSAEKVTFRLFTIRQQTKEEREQEERCRQLALEQSCKEKAAKKACRKLQEAEECRKKEEAKKCSQSEEKQKPCPKKLETPCPKQDYRISKCKQMQAEAEERKCKEEFEQMCKLAEEKEKEAEMCRKAKEERRKEEAEKCRKAEEEQRKKKAEKCRKAEAERRKQEAEKCRKAEEERRREEAEKCRKAEEERRRKEAEKCRKAEEERRKKEAERQKKEAEKCRKAAEERRREEAEKCRKAAEERMKEEAEKCRKLEQERKCKLAEEKKRNEEELKIIEAEVAKLEAAEKAKRLKEEEEKKAELKNCKLLNEAKKKKEEADRCKREQRERELAEMEKKWKQFAEKRKRKKEAEMCRKIEEEKEKAEAESADKLLKDVCEKLKQSLSDPDNSKKGKK